MYFDYKCILNINVSRKRNEFGKLSDYKKGPAVFAIKTNATIIPVVIKGTATNLHFGTYINRIR